LGGYFGPAEGLGGAEAALPGDYLISLAMFPEQNGLE
jgi:hypothetical protein